MFNTHYKFGVFHWQAFIAVCIPFYGKQDIIYEHQIVKQKKISNQTKFNLNNNNLKYLNCCKGFISIKKQSWARLISKQLHWNTQFCGMTSAFFGSPQGDHPGDKQ